MDNSQSQKSLAYYKAIGNQKNQNESSRHKIQREKIKPETYIQKIQDQFFKKRQNSCVI